MVFGALPMELVQYGFLAVEGARMLLAHHVWETCPVTKFGIVRCFVCQMFLGRLT